MQRSIYLAKLIGPVAAAIGIGMLVNMPVYRAMGMQFLHSHALIYLSGLITMTVGIALVLAHNVWKPDWRVIITILGWLATIGGAVRIVAPQQVETLGLRLMGDGNVGMIAGFVVLVLGVVLSYFGYVEEATQPTRKRARRPARRRRA